MQESVNEQRPQKIFADAKEVEITRAIAEEFFSVLQDRAESDVIIIGAGPAGLTATAVSPSIVSGLVVAMVRKLSSFSILYFI